MSSLNDALQAPSVLQVLMAAPDEQVKRMQIAYNAVAEGRWEDAAHSIRNAILEESEKATPATTASGKLWVEYAQECLDSIQKYCL